MSECYRNGFTVSVRSSLWNHPVPKMLRVCQKLRAVDAKSKRLGIVRTETDYLRALLDAMADMDRYAEVEVLKSLGDVNLEKGQLDNNTEKYDRAMVLYRTALLRSENADVGESLEYRYHYAEKLRLGKRFTASSSYEPLTSDKKMSSLAKVVEKFEILDRRMTVGGNKETLLIEYTRLVVEGIVKDDNMLETESIKSLGDVYLKRGTETRDAPCLTKATALYNTALARCERIQGTVALIHRLLYTARIRQETKPPKHRAQQRKGHVLRDFPMTSPNTDVTGASKGQPSMTYKQYLTTGGHALTDGKLDVAEQDFASALRLVHNPNKPDRCKEAECLCRLGDVYVQRGKRTKEGRKFTQAAALYNAAMARTDRNKHSVTKKLEEIEQWFLRYTANVEIKPVPSDSTIRHQKRLQEMRTRAKSQLDVINEQHNPYQYDEDDPVMITVEADRAEAVKALFKNIAKDRQMFIEDLVGECITTLGPHPCKYAFIGLGSQATELVTPYSDLEFAILIEDGKDNDVTRRYFLNLTHYLHLKVINLGETILPSMAIPSLNDFPENDWFFDSITPRGFAFDGFMPWASKTPFGRDQTKTKPPVSLIQTPAEMAKFQRLDVSVAEGYHLSDILRRVVFLTGEEALVTEYVTKLKGIITGDLLSCFRSRLSATQMLWESREQFDTLEPTGQLLNVKKDIYRFPGIAIEILALCCQIIFASTWDMIDELKETGKINEENASHLTVLTSISAELRLRTYLANGGQRDTMSPLIQMKYQSKPQEVSDTTLSSIFHVPNIQVLFRYYCRAIPLKKCIPESLQVQQNKVLKTTILDTSHECRGRISIHLFLFNSAKLHLEAALKDVGSDNIKRVEILHMLGTLWAFFDDCKTGISMHEEALRVCKNIYDDNTANPATAVSLNNLGWSWSNLGDHNQAISFYEQSLSMTKTIYGNNTEHPDIAASLNNLGSSWNGLGIHKKAISYYEQSLTMKKTIYGYNTAHPDIAASLNNLGSSWNGLGVHKKAISYHEQSLTMKKTIYGYNTAHPDVAKSLNNLGSSWSRLGEHKKAISFYEQSLSMKKTIYGDSTAHPDVAGSLNNLGLSWSNLSNHKKAISYYEQSLTIRKVIYGDNTEHPDIAASLNNLGSSWNDLGNHKKAISYHEQSLTMKKTIYGYNTAHPDVATSLNNLGLSWTDLGDHKKAISYFEQSLSIWNSTYRDNTAHPHIAGSLNNIGSSWDQLGDHNKAISFYEQSLSMTKTIYGNNTAHPDIAASLNNLGRSWSQLGDDKKAISYYEQSLSIWNTTYGDKTAHPDTAKSLNNIGSSWGQLSDHKKAISYYEQSLTMMKTIYGDNTVHPDIARALSNIGSSWSKLGDHKKAISYYEQSLTMRKTIYGDNTAHPHTAKSLINLGSSWSELGNHKKAISYYEQSLSICNTIYGDKTAHPHTTESLINLGSSWGKLGDHKKAISYYERLLTMMKTIYGDNTAHPDVAKTLYKLQLAWTKIGDYQRAMEFKQQSQSMQRPLKP
ncbi:uncharacterized protein [Branchiostoma lanceolatum]|uniref:uncharacterized protein n=1 Tax=Branchiostoma lanceolatum TaxID=7740 RepID=UPI0034550D32